MGVSGQRSRRSRVGAGLAIGIGVGTALGAAMGKLAIGVAIGVALGMALGAANRTRPPVTTELEDDATE